MSTAQEIGETQILAAMLGVAEMVGDLTDIDEMLGAVVRIASSLVQVDRCAVLAYDPASREFRAVASFGPGSGGTPFEGVRFAESDMPRLAQRLLRLHLPALVKADSKDAALPAAVVKRLGLKAALLVPLVCRGRVLGVLWLDHTAQSHYFTSKEINVVQGIATSVAVALDAAQRIENLELEQRRFDALARTLSDGVIILDPTSRILEMSRGAEELLGWQSSEVRGRRAHEVFDISAAETTVAWTREASGPSLAPKGLSLRARAGTYLPCEVLAVPVRNEAGERVQILYVLKRRGEGKRADTSAGAGSS